MLLFFLIFYSFAPLVISWFCDGHMAVAQIALDCGIMTPATTAAAEDLITFLFEDYPSTGPSFVESACWADDLKAMSTGQEADWHFIDLPVCRQESGDPCPLPPPTDNVVWAIKSAQTTIFAPKSAKLDKARQLRFMIHVSNSFFSPRIASLRRHFILLQRHPTPHPHPQFVGDVHQPLHAATYFSSQFPSGDRGGNSWNVSGFNWTTELHALWDGGLGMWSGDLERPLNASGKEWLSDLSARVRELYPVASMQPSIKIYNASTWANESFSLAESFVYPGVPPSSSSPPPVPQDYVTKGQGIALKQLAIAGYRLADLIQYIFTTPGNAKFSRLSV